MEALHSSLPDNRLVVLPGQPHDAALTAPDLYLRQVLRFWGAPVPRVETSRAQLPVALRADKRRISHGFRPFLPPGTIVVLGVKGRTAL